MIEFQWIWVFALLPLPLLVYYFVPASTARQDAALKVPFIQDFHAAGEFKISAQRQRIMLFMGFVAWLALIVAGARPQWLGEAVELPISGRDLLLAVDLSGSMEYEDFVVNNKMVDRLTATKYVASDFIDRRVGDRLGLILFGKQAYLQTPLTFDRATVKTLLLESIIGIAGRETAIGDAIGLAIKRFRTTGTDNKNSANTNSTSAKEKEANTEKEKDKILILLTDGANTAGEINPIKAAEIAAGEHLKIYTIGVGADEMIVRSFFGSKKINPSQDLDEETLKAVAAKTGGRYFRARDTKDLENIYTLLDELEPVVQDAQSFRPKKSLYYWPLGLAFILIMLLAIRHYKTS